MAATSKAFSRDGAVIYCRVSTKEQAENLSLEVQEKTCREYCEKNGWQVLEVFSEAESAKTVNRVEFQEMLTYCGLNHKRIAAVVFYDNTRFSRETVQALHADAFLYAKGIVLRSATQPYDDSPAGDFMKTLLFAYGTFDNKLKAQKTIAGMKAAINKGLWV